MAWHVDQSALTTTDTYITFINLNDWHIVRLNQYVVTVSCFKVKYSEILVLLLEYQYINI
jgi:hypothetical protein